MGAQSTPWLSCMSSPSLADLSQKVDSLAEQVEKLTLVVGRLAISQESVGSYSVVPSVAAGPAPSVVSSAGPSLSQVGSGLGGS